MPKSRNKRPNGEGSIYFDEEKHTWRAMLTTPAGKRMTKSGKEEKAVRDWFNEQRLLIGRNQHIEPHSITLYQWIKEWLKVYAKNRVKPITYDRYVSLLAHMEPLYDQRLLSITTTDIQKVLNGMLNDSGFKPRTVAHAYDCLRNCLNKAVELNMLRINPVLAAEKPTIPRNEIEILTTDEVQRLLDAADCYRNPLVLHLLYATGMRISEVLALRKSDINIKKRLIFVNRTVHYSDSAKLYYSDTKTSSSRRIIDVPESIIKMIVKHCLAKKIRDDALLFTNSYGGGETPDHYCQRIYSKIREDAGVHKGLHCFRHTHATELLGQGVPVHDVSRRLGHASISTTQNIYSHFLPDSNERMMQAVSTLLSKIQ